MSIADRRDSFQPGNLHPRNLSVHATYDRVSIQTYWRSLRNIGPGRGRPCHSKVQSRCPPKSGLPGYDPERRQHCGGDDPKNKATDADDVFKKGPKVGRLSAPIGDVQWLEEMFSESGTSCLMFAPIHVSIARKKNWSSPRCYISRLRCRTYLNCHSLLIFCSAHTMARGWGTWAGREWMNQTIITISSWKGLSGCQLPTAM